METEYDKITQASLNGIYVKAIELDRGHNTVDAPIAPPPGFVADAETHASAYDCDAETHASAYDCDAETRASDAGFYCHHRY